VAAGETFGAALLGDGTLWTWGGSLEPEAHVPRQIPGLHCADLQAARDRIACIDATGVTLLGYSHGDFTPVPELSGLLSLVEADMTLVGGGDRRGLVHVEGVGRHDLPLAHAAAPNVLVDERGVAWSAEGHSFALGSAAAVLAESSPAVGVAASAAVDASGTLWRWGENSRGQLGDGTTTARLHPGEVPDFHLFSDPWFVQDADLDGLDNLAEHYLGSDPLRADTNGDGVVDGASVAIGRDPVSVDLDADGLTNAAETQAGTGVFNPDSDGDGVLDGLDAFPLDPSRSEPPQPDPTDAVAPLILLREPASAVLISTTP
jgi:hypothetical protein